LPAAVLNLLTVARLKVYGAMYAIEQLSHKGDDFHIRIHDDQNANLDGRKLMAIAAKFENRIRLQPGAHIIIEIKCKGLSQEQSLEMVETFLVQYKEALKTKGELHNVAK